MISQVIRNHMLATDATAGQFANNLPYAALGLCGELGEYKSILEVGSKENMQEEIGDVLWYTSRIARILKLDADEIGEQVERFMIHTGSGVIPEAVRVMDANASIIAELVKKSMRGVEIDREWMTSRLAAIYWAVNVEARLWEGTLEEVVNGNIAKLKGRHPNGWGSGTK